MIELFAGAVIAALALVFVLWPLIVRPSAGTAGKRAAARPVPTASDSAIRALREIEFDRATGKLADFDYDELKAQYTALALAEMRAAQPAAVAGATASTGDLVDAMISAARAGVATCTTCDTIRPEPGAVYCSSCGTYLPGKCTKCGAAVSESGAHFCSSCGWQLAA